MPQLALNRRLWSRVGSTIAGSSEFYLILDDHLEIILILRNVCHYLLVIYINCVATFLTIWNYSTSPLPPSSPLSDHWLNNPSPANLTQGHPVCWDRGSTEYQPGQSRDLRLLFFEDWSMETCAIPMALGRSWQRPGLTTPTCCS